MELRPHHILCIGKFTGHGYDERFTRHMTDVVARLGKQPDTVITLTDGQDELCLYCPNNKCGACTSQEKVDRLDSTVRNLCRLPDGETTWSELCRLSRTHIYSADAFPLVCSECEWFPLCMATETNYS